LFDAVVVQIRQVIAGGGADEGGALEFGGIDVGSGVEVGVDVAVRPVIEVDGRNAEGRILIDVVIAAHGVRRVFGAQRLFAALGSDERVFGFAGGGEFVGLFVGEISESPRDVVDEAGQAHGAACHVEHRFGFRAAADHVHVDGGFDALGQFGPE